MIYMFLDDIDMEMLALLVTLTLVLVGLTFAIVAHLLFKMQAEIKKLRQSVQVETKQISEMKEHIQPINEPAAQPAPPQVPAQPVSPQEPQTPPPAQPEAEMVQLEEAENTE